VSAALILVLIVAVAYLATHLTFDWIARRFLIVSGAEYLLLGILVGPQVSGLVTARTIDSFAPLATLALGWVGAIVGTQFRVTELVRIPGVLYEMAFAESVATLLVVAGLLGLALMWLFDLAPAAAALPALALGAIAAASAPAGIEVVARHTGARGPIMRLLQVSTAIDALVAIVVVGLLACVRRPPIDGPVRPLTATEWAVVSLALGLVGGALFHLFLGAERKVDRIVVSLGGAVILVSGAAAYLRLSPLLPAMIFGATLANTSSSRDEIAETLARGERPFYYALLIFAGIAWAPSVREWVVPAALFLLTRAAGKIGGARLGARLTGTLPLFGPHWGRALLGQGGLALALALDYVQQPGSPFPNIVFTAAIASVLLTDLSAARLVQSTVLPLLEQEVSPVRVASRILTPGRGARAGDGAGRESQRQPGASGAVRESR
jgi:hypothetical protein